MIAKPRPHTKRRSPKRFAVLSALLVTGVSALVYAVAPPANTQIGNQATARYFDAGNTERQVSSNTVITVVQQVSSFTLTADQSKPASPGSPVYFPHTLTNTGNGTDAFPLNVTQSAGDNFDLTNLAIYADANGDGQPDDPNSPLSTLVGGVATATTGPLAGGAVFRFVVSGIVPATATSAQTGVVTVAANGTATTTPAVSATNTDTVTVTNNAVVNVIKSMNSATGTANSGPYTVTLTYNNTGNATATSVVLTDVIPAGFTYVADSGRWSLTGTTILTNANDGTQGAGLDTIAYDFGATVAGRVTATISRVQPGETRTVTFQVNVPAGRAAGPIANTAQYSYDPDGPGPLPPTSTTPTNTFVFTVTQGTAVSVGDSTVNSVPQGGTVVFTNTVTNLGNGDDRFNITVANSTFPAGTTFQIFKTDGNTPLQDTNGDNIPDTGVLSPSGAYDVIVKAILPPGSAGNNVNYTAIVTGRSVVDTTGATSDTGNDVVVNVTANSSDLTNNAAQGTAGALGVGPGPGAAAIVTNTTAPGTTTRFTLVMKNTNTAGGPADTFNLTLDQSFGALPSGWTVVLRDAGGATVTSTGTLAAQASFTFFADVTVPAGQAPITQDLYFRALSPSTGSGDIIRDAVTVSAVRSLALTPNNTGQVAPNGTVVYSHTLTNTGTVLEGNNTVSTVALGLANNRPGWSAVTYYDANNNGLVDTTDPVVTDLNFVSGGTAGLSPGESVRLLVKVSAPPGASVGETNVTTLSATTTNGSYTSAVPAVVTATDTSSVINGDIVILKEQALDAANDGTADGAFTQANITALPGGAIRYRITVRNNGTAPATNVRVFDTTPAFTTYTTVGPAAVTGGTAPGVTTAPTNGATGAFEFNVGTLNPGETAAITFGVTVDQ